MGATEQRLQSLSYSLLDKSIYFLYSFSPCSRYLTVTPFSITSKPSSSDGYRQVLMEIAHMFYENMAISLPIVTKEVFFFFHFCISKSFGLAAL